MFSRFTDHYAFLDLWNTFMFYWIHRFPPSIELAGFFAASINLAVFEWFTAFFLPLVKLYILHFSSIHLPSQLLIFYWSVNFLLYSFLSSFIPLFDRSSLPLFIHYITRSFYYTFIIQFFHSFFDVTWLCIKWSALTIHYSFYLPFWYFSAFASFFTVT